jgi:hypothetical protein
MKKSILEEAIRTLAAKQFGLIGRAQAIEVGLTRAGVHRRRAAKKWEVVCPGVYRLKGTPGSDHQRILAVCLSEGPFAFASHATAAHLWGLDGFTRVMPTPIEVSVPHGTIRRIPGVVVHQRRDLMVEQPARFGEIPTASLERTLIDLATALDSQRLERAFDSAWRKTPDLPALLSAYLEKLGADGRKGIHLIDALV